MKRAKSLLLIDSVINLFLGAILLGYSAPVIKLFGLPETELFFYPNILGAVLVGIGIALIIEFRGKGEFFGLGFGGAVSINMAGGIVLFIWLVSGNLNVPGKGKIILWVLDVILVVISSLELLAYMRRK